MWSNLGFIFDKHNEFIKNTAFILLFRALMLPFLGSQLRTIFFLEDYKMMPCLPLKTGTTNWQRALVSLLYVEDGQPKLDPNDVVKVK